MVKKSEINKKGRLAKSTLSVVLAASMVLTSSSFVWAAPVEDIAVVEEGDVVVEAVAAPVEEAVGTSVDEVSEASAEENVREAGDIIIGPIADQVYTGKEIKPVLAVSVEGGASTPDYVATYSKNINVGIATVTVKVVNSNKTATQTFKITPKPLTGAVISLQDIAFVYNGNVQQPNITSVVIGSGDAAVTVPADAYEITPGKTETTDLTSAGTQTLTITAKDNGNFSGSATASYEIQQASLKAEDVTITSRKKAYGSALQKNDVTVTIKSTGKTLAASEYDIFTKDQYGDEVSIPANAAVGTHGFYIKTTGASGNYVAGTEVPSTYEVISPSLQTKVDAANLATVVGNTFNGFTKDSVDGVYKVEYTGDDKWPTILKVTNEIIAESSFKVATKPAKWVNAGKYSIELNGINDYPGVKAIVDFEIKAKELSDSMVSASYSTTHSGNNTKAVVEVIDGSKVLVEGTDYTYTEDTAKRTVTVKGIGNYSGEAKADVIFTKMDLDNPAITATVAGTYNYTNGDIKVRVKDISVIENDATPYTLEYGAAKDYKLKGTVVTDAVNGDYIEVPGNAGEAVITIEPGSNGKYTGERDIKFIINGTAFNDVFTIDAIKDLRLGSSNLLQDIANAIKVRYKSTGAEYKGTYTSAVYASDDTDLETPLNSITEVGTYKVVVTPSPGQYSGTLETTVKVVGKTIENAQVAKIKDQKYTGKAIEPVVKVEVSAGADQTTVLVKDKDYTVSYTNNIKSGVANAIIEGMGEYSGKIIVPFNIVGQMDQNIEFLTAQVKDIKNRTLASKETVVKYNKDQEPKTDVTYSSSDDKVFTVDAKTGAIKYTGVGTATLTATAAESDIYKAETKTMTVRVVPRTPASVSAASVSAKKITVKAAEVEEAAYYQVKIWKKGHNAVFVNVKNEGALDMEYTTKSAGTFNVQVRTFMYPGSKVPDNYLSKFSATYTVKVSK